MSGPAATPATPATPASAALSPEEITARSGSNFLSGFLCLDAARRRGMTGIYAFCRVADDAVDDAPDVATGRRDLAFWRAELAAAAAGTAATPVGRALQQAMRDFEVRRAPLDELLDGMAMDLEPQPFADEAALRGYCYRVASAVGLACLPVLGASGPAAERFADALGKALQLTNILRDLRGDAQIGRIYVPVSWREACGVDPAWLRGDGPPSAYADDGPLHRLGTCFVAAAEREFATARAALRELPRAQRRALVPARIMGAVYRAMLDRLAARRGDLCGERVRVPKLRKLWLGVRVLAGVQW